MEPLKLSDILLPGTKLVARKINPNNPRIKKLVARTKKLQKEALDRMKFDPEQLKAYITI